MTKIIKSIDTYNDPSQIIMDKWDDMLKALYRRKGHYLLDDFTEDKNGNYLCIFYEEGNPDNNFPRTISHEEFLAFLHEERANYWEIYDDRTCTMIETSCSMDDLLIDSCFDKREYLELFVNRGQGGCNC